MCNFLQQNPRRTLHWASKLVRPPYQNPCRPPIITPEGARPVGVLLFHCFNDPVNYLHPVVHTPFSMRCLTCSPPETQVSATLKVSCPISAQGCCFEHISCSDGMQPLLHPPQLTEAEPAGSGTCNQRGGSDACHAPLQKATQAELG